MASILDKVRPGDLRAISGLTAVLWLLPYLYLVSRFFKVPFLGTFLLDRDRSWFMLAPFCHAAALSLYALATRRFKGASAWAAGLGGLFLAAAPPVFFLLFNRHELAQGAGKAFVSLAPLLLFWVGYLAISGLRSANFLLCAAYAFGASCAFHALALLLPRWRSIFLGQITWQALAWLGLALVCLLALAVNWKVMRQDRA